MKRELVVGHSVLGRPIEAVHFAPPSYAKPRPAALLFGAIHGDEPVSQLMLERLADELIERPPSRDTWIVPCLNVDGMIAGTRNNASDVDLNRNFASANWGSDRRPGYNPGADAEDQPETRALVELIERIGAERLVAVHATLSDGELGGRARQLAKRDVRALRLPGRGRHGLSEPGIVRHEVRRRARPRGRDARVALCLAEEQGWHEYPSALRWCVDLPD